MSRRPAITVVPIHLQGNEALLAHVRRGLERAFGAVTHQKAPWFDPDAALDRVRAQYNSRALLAELQRDTGHHKVLGICGVDLFMPVLTFVFGEAELGGRAAVISLHRLRSENYGLPADDALLQERSLKEAIHELGHAHGLIHCLDPSCVMHSSTYVEEIDLRPASFCKRCEERRK